MMQGDPKDESEEKSLCAAPGSDDHFYPGGYFNALSAGYRE